MDDLHSVKRVCHPNPLLADHDSHRAECLQVLSETMSPADGVVKALVRRSDKFAEEADFGAQALEVNRRLTGLAPNAARYWFRLGRCWKSVGQHAKA